MQATQFVMAHGVEQDRLRAILPEGLPPCGRCFGSTGRKRLSRIPDSRGKRREKGSWRLAQHRQLFQRAV